MLKKICLGFTLLLAACHGVQQQPPGALSPDSPAVAKSQLPAKGCLLLDGQYEQVLGKSASIKIVQTDCTQLTFSRLIGVDLYRTVTVIPDGHERAMNLVFQDHQGHTKNSGNVLAMCEFLSRVSYEDTVQITFKILSAMNPNVLDQYRYTLSFVDENNLLYKEEMLRPTGLWQALETSTLPRIK
jgi:hypothetical protein